MPPEPLGVPQEILAVARRVAAIVRRVTGDSRYRVMLFGSWAAGHATARSDIDIGILGPCEVEPAAMLEIREAYDALPTLHTIDLVDLATVATGVRRGALAAALEVDPA